ncbi:MAG: FHA domain-containing protein [Aristaeellaceae bacterium]
MPEVCNASPYMGKEPFAFAVYSRKDQSEAFTLIEKLASEGYRIFFAQPEPSSMQRMEETARQISERLGECAALIALYSSEAAADHHFRKVVTAAVLNGKPVLPVFLEDVELSCGMKLQFPDKARTNWYAMTDDLLHLMDQPAMKSIQGKPNPAIRIEARKPGIRSGAAQQEKPKRHWPVSVILVDEEEILQQKQLEKNAADGLKETERAAAEQAAAEKAATEKAAAEKAAAEKAAAEKAAAEKAAAEKAAAEKAAAEKAAAEIGVSRHASRAGNAVHRRTAIEQAEHEEAPSAVRQHNPTVPGPAKTVLIEENDGAQGDKDTTGPKRGAHGTVILDEIPPVCVLLATGERIQGRCGVTKIGRDESCDICIPEETVSFQHLELISFYHANNTFKNTIRDCRSSNGSWVDGERLESGAAVSVGDQASVDLGRNVHLFVAFGTAAQALMARSTLACLEYAQTGERHAVGEQKIILGRNDPFCNGFFDDMRISWEHAQLWYENGEYLIRDQSSNGTSINGTRMEKYSTACLRDGTEIVMGRSRYIFRLIALKEKQNGQKKAN